MAFTKVINTRVGRSLDEVQDDEQAGFRSEYSTVDNIQVLTQIVEKTSEYNLPLFMLFIDYEKAFDSVENNAVWGSLQDAQVHPTIIEVLRHIYEEAKSEVVIDGKRVGYDAVRGVRQGDPLSPKLFTACLQPIFNRLQGKEREKRQR